MKEKTTENLEIFYDPSINIQIDQSLIQASTSKEPPKPSFNMPKNKKKTLIIIIFLIAILISTVSVSFAMTNKNGDNQQNEIPIDDEAIEELSTPIENEEEYETIKLADLSNAFNNLSTIKQYNTTEGYTILSTVSDNSFIIIVESDTKREFTFDLKDNILTKTTTSDDLDSIMMFIYLETAKAILDGLEENEVLTVLSDSSASTMTLEENGSAMTNTNGEIILQLALNKKIALIDLNSEYVTTKDLEQYTEILKGTGSLSGHSGNIYYYYNYDLNTPEIPATATLLIAEPKNFTSLAYNSLLSFIKVIYDDTEVTNFQMLYPSIQEGIFGKYSIDINPDNENYNSYYNKDYVVLEVKFVK